MMHISSARIATAMQRACAKQVLSQSFLGSRISLSTNASLSILHPFALDAQNREDQKSLTVYQRAMPRNISPMGLVLPQTRYFSTTEADQSSYRQRVVERATNLRDNARESYKEFKEHPRESMKSGAKSFSGMMRKYGPVFLGTYFVVYVSTLGTLFSCIESGLLDPVYLFSLFGNVNPEEAKSTAELVVEWMKNHSFTEKYAPYVERYPSLANFAIAWISVKFTEPVRAPLALGLTPRVARFLGYTNQTDDQETETTKADEEPQNESTKKET